MSACQLSARGHTASVLLSLEAGKWEQPQTRDLQVGTPGVGASEAGRAWKGVDARQLLSVPARG